VTILADTITEATSWATNHRNSDALRADMANHGCYIYGAGGYGRQVAAALRARAIPLKGFVDTFVGGGKPVADVPCWLPDEFPGADAAGSVLVIAVNNFKVPVAGISKWARDKGFADIVYVPELPDVLDPALGQYWQSTRALMEDSADAIARFDALLGDAKSREILAALVRYRITGLPEDHPDVDRDHQYFPVDLPLGKDAINVIDCGAFPGDMIEAVSAAGLTLNNWYAFEPDPANFVRLGQVAAAAELGSASLFPCGVGDATGMIRFQDGEADASRASADADHGVLVPIVRVEDVVQARLIDMVKLDIEGFEAQAIDGMAGLLDRHRPRVAVAVYHKPADLWEIAFKLEGLFPGSRYAIRQHGHNGYDTVLYADLAA
jgi:FkbM family methyltransferase